MRTITLEEHFASPGFLAGPGAELLAQSKQPNHPLARIPGQLLDVGPGRIAAMDAAGIDVQVLSINAPGVEQLDADEAAALARESNEYLADAIKKYPER